MKVSISDLRKNIKKVVAALEHNEQVTLTYRCRKLAVIVPAAEEGPKTKVADHAAFGMWADREDLHDVPGYVRELRKLRSF